MIKSEKKLKELVQKVGSSNNITSSQAIRSLRNEEPFEGAISLLTGVYDKTDDPVIRKSIEEFLNDLKDPSVRPEVIAEIRRVWKSGTISMLVSSCWQSGLDYSRYSLDFAGIFVNGDYLTALECMTVIEESAGYMSREMKDRIINLLKNVPGHPDGDKTALARELISLLE